jgi:transcriptional regulator with XRE-family HTH domain
MLPIELQTPREMALGIAGRAKALRLYREWTQEETADRAGITLATYRRFERTGMISLERLLRLAVILDARRGFDILFQVPPARSIKELERQDESRSRKRGKRREWPGMPPRGPGPTR